MVKKLTESESQAFFAAPHIAVLSLPSDDERPPLAFPGWYGYEPGGDIAYYTHLTDPPSRKLRIMREHSVLSLCVQREELPYKYVTVEGTISGIDTTPATERLLAIVRRYLPEDDAQGYVAGEQTSGVNLGLFTIRPDRWSGFDFGDEG